MSGIGRLSESLDNISNNTSTILRMLQNFETRLSVVDGHISTIREETLLPSKAKKNVDATLIQIEKINEYFKVSGEVESIISAGFKGSHDDFFYAVQRLAAAKDFFEVNKEIKSSNPIIIKITGQLKFCCTISLKYLDTLLETMGTTLVKSPEGIYRSTNPLDETLTSDLRGICTSLHLAKTRTHFKTYLTARTKHVLDNLKVIETSASLTAPYTEGPYEKGAHVITKYFQVCAELLKAEVTISSVVLPQAAEDSIDVLSKLISAALDELSRVLNVALLISSETKKEDNDILAHSNAFLISLDILRAFLHSYADLWEGCCADATAFKGNALRLVAIKDLLVSTAMKSMARLLFCVFDEKNASTIGVPDSCDASYMTIHVLHCCRQLLHFSGAYQMLQETVAQGKTKAKVTPPTSPNELVFNLINRLIRFLGVQQSFLSQEVPEKSTYKFLLAQSMTSHAMYEHGEKDAMLRLLPSRKHLYMLNNTYQIAMFLTEKEAEANGKPGVLGDLLGTTKKIIIDEQNSFCKAVIRALGFAPEDTQFSKQFEKDTTSKYKVLKTKFSCFNAGIDALCANRGEWRATNPDLRESLNEQMKNSILNAYSGFFNENSKVQFSRKHTQQYLRYPPMEVDRVLKKFFG